MNNFRSLAVTILLACALATFTSCSSSRLPNSEQPSRSQKRPGLNEANLNLDFRLTNFTGSSLRNVYLSPTTSNRWEENVLGGAQLKDGDTVDIHFNPTETTTTWDLRIEGPDGHYAEWKNLKLGDISEMTLLLKATPEPVVIAQVE